MRKIYLSILIVILIIGCSDSSDNREDIKLQKGMEGLTIGFAKDGLPKEVFEEGKLYATFELQNEGFYDIKQGVLAGAIHPRPLCHPSKHLFITLVGPTKNVLHITGVCSAPLASLVSPIFALFALVVIKSYHHAPDGKHRTYTQRYMAFLFYRLT